MALYERVSQDGESAQVGPSGADKYFSSNAKPAHIGPDRVRPRAARGGDFLAARTPRVLWVELTSKCPFDCIFCSRQTRRGAGRHLPFDTYTRLIEDLVRRGAGGQETMR